MMAQTFDLAQQFSRYPFGRFTTHGPASGERFRDEVLVPALRAGEAIEVSLDGAKGLGPSFLEEAFGGLVRAGFTPAEIERLISVRSVDDPSYLAEIRSYIAEAAAHAH